MCFKNLSPYTQLSLQTLSNEHCYCSKITHKTNLTVTYIEHHGAEYVLLIQTQSNNESNTSVSVWHHKIEANTN